MSEADRFEIRMPRSLKRNVKRLVGNLYELGLRDNRSVSAYVIEAVKEKRDKDYQRASLSEADDFTAQGPS